MHIIFKDNINVDNLVLYNLFDLSLQVTSSIDSFILEYKYIIFAILQFAKATADQKIASLK